MADGLKVAEAVGSTPVADGKWHHAALVVDCVKQQLSVYLDGQLDAVVQQAGQPVQNPVDISGIGASSSVAPLAIGSLRGQYAYVGDVAEVSVLMGAQSPERLPAGGVAVPNARMPEPERAGWYITESSDWRRRQRSPRCAPKRRSTLDRFGRSSRRQTTTLPRMRPDRP
jgi:hypothetical protein